MAVCFSVVITCSEFILVFIHPRDDRVAAPAFLLPGDKTRVRCRRDAMSHNFSNFTRKGKKDTSNTVFRMGVLNENLYPCLIVHSAIEMYARVESSLEF
jgi:hypothetical protein